MKKISFLLLIITSLFTLYSCDEDTKADEIFNYITFADPDYSTGVDIGGSTTIDVVVLTSNISGSDRSFDVIVDTSSSDAADGSYDVPSSVIVPSGKQEGKLTITLSDVNLGIGVNNLVINFEDEEGLFHGASTTVAYTQNCIEVTASLDFIFDNWASETGWSIEDSLGGTVVSGGGYSDGQAPTSENIILCTGRNYTLHVTDAFSDGMDDGTNLGSYTLTIGGVVKVTGGGAFGAIESTGFDTN